MQFWLAYVDAIDEPFDPAIHCGINLSAFAFELVHNEGEIATITVTREQSSWGVVAPGMKRHVILSESPTGDPADAFVIARGRITGLPTDLWGPTQDITIECSEWDLFMVRDRGGTLHDGRLMRYCREHLQGTPETCWVLDDNDPDVPSSYLSGRAENFFFDPATFAVSTSHLVDGARLVNLSDYAFHDDEVPAVSITEWPTARYRMQLRAEWTQQARGYCDIAWRMGSITTLSPDFLEHQAGELPQGLTDIRLGTGWTLESSDVACIDLSPTMALNDGRAGNIYYQGMSSGGDIIDHVQLHRVTVRYEQWRFRFRQVLMRFEYEQQRIESIDLSLDVPMQGVPTIQLEDDLGEVGTVDLTNETYDGTTHPTAPWEPRFYAKGERVTHSVYSYECLADHESTTFYQKPEGYPVWPTGHVPEGWTWHPYWKKVPSLAPIEMHVADFSGATVGQDVVAHCMLRLRKRAIERLRCIEAEMTYLLDELTTDITTRDSVRVELPWFDGTTRAVIGKVIGTKKRWDAEEGGTMVLRLGVSVGTGAEASTLATHRTPYGPNENYMWGYVGSAGDPVFGVAGDTEYVVDADEVRAPVDVRQLTNAGYSVTKVDWINDASAQYRKAVEAGSHRRRPSKAIQRHPTRVRVQMRDLDTTIPFERWVFVAGEMLTTPRGIDLTGGDEL